MKKMISLPALTALATAVSATLVSAPATAGGLTLNEQSASGMGTAYAGRASSALDASTVFGNPAGMSRLGAQASGGFAVIDAHIDIRSASGDAPGSNRGDMVPFSVIPFGYYVNPINDDWHFGIGLYAPFGGDADYERNFQGRYKGTQTTIQVVTVQPTLSYKLNERMSVGVGAMIGRIDGTLAFNLDTAALGGAGDGRVKSTGHDYGVGYNIGFIADLTDATTLGLTYRSKVEYNLRGETKARNFPATGAALGLIDGDYRGKLDFTSPEAAEISVTHRLDDRWTLHGGAMWTRWDRLSRIVIDNNAQGSLQTLEEEVQWRNTWAYALGASYQLNPSWVLRAGAALDESPATNDFRSVRTPYGNRKVVSLGAGWSPTANLTVDLAYAYLWESKASINQPAEPLRPGYAATYDTDAHGLSAQFTYKY